MVYVKMVNSETARETGSLLCRIALWDCFKDIGAPFTTLTISGKLGPDSSTKTIQYFNPDSLFSIFEFPIIHSVCPPNSA